MKIEIKVIKRVRACMKKLYNSEEPLKIEWGIAGFILLFLIVLFLHGDTKNLITWSINMLDVTFQGHPLEYYKYSIENPNMAPTQYVSGTLYSLMLWAVWNLPIWIAKQAGGVEVLNNPLVWIWGKLFLALCLGITLKFIYNIVKEMTNDNNRAKWAMFLMTTSVFVYTGIGYGGQNDIVICMFATAAIDCLIKKKYKMFYFLAGMAISVKYFFLIPYVAIILLLEKKIYRIVLKVFVGCGPTLIYWLGTRFCPMINESANQGSPVGVLLREMVGGAFPVVYGNAISLFIAMLLIVYVLAYLTIPKDDEEKNKFLIYYIVAASMSMLLFSTFQYYRVVMLCPFMVILLVMDEKKMRINIILETIVSGCLFGLLLVQAYSVLYASTIIQEDIIKLLFHCEVRVCPGLVMLAWANFSQGMIDLGCQILATIVVVLSIVVLLINYPRIKDNVINIPQLKVERWIYWVRGLMVLIPVLYLIYVAIIQYNLN